VVRAIELRKASDDSDDHKEPLLHVGPHKKFIGQVAFGAGDRRLLTRESGGLMYAWLGFESELERGQTLMESKTTQGFGRSYGGTLLKHLEGVGEVVSFDVHPSAPEGFLVDRGSTIEEWDLGFSFDQTDGWKHTAEGSHFAAWMPDGAALVAGFDDGHVLLYEVGVGEPTRVICDGVSAVSYIAVSSDGEHVAVTTEDGMVRLHPTADGGIVSEVPAPSAALSVVFVGDDRTLAIGCADGTVILWNVDSGSRPRRIGTVASPVRGLGATPQGNFLIASSRRGLTAWNLREDIEQWSTGDDPRRSSQYGIPAGRLAVSGDGQLVVYGTEAGTVPCLNVLTGELVSVTSVPPSTPLSIEHVTAVGMADDNRTAFAGLWDGTLCIIDVLRGRELFRFPAHSEAITSLAQAPGSGRVLTSSVDPDLAGSNQYVRVWDILETSFVRPDPDSSDWAQLAEASFRERHGEPTQSHAAPGAGDLELSFAPSTDSPASDGAPQGSASDIATLRTALRQDPKSPHRHLDLALAYLQHGEREKARDSLERVCGLDGEELIHDAEAQYVIAESLLLEDRPAEAERWLVRAGDQSHPEALLQLGILLLNGYGVERDEAKGLAALHASAALGNAIAAQNLGIHTKHNAKRDLQ
jgi:WD40 repeat protein